jgi:RND family efflux transporter MFP subunit
MPESFECGGDRGTGRRRGPILPLHVLSLALLLLIPTLAPAQGPRPARVVLGEAREEVLEQRREATGHLRASRRAMLAAEESGLVVHLDLRPGDEIEAGDVIAQLHDTRARIAMDRAQAELLARHAIVAQRRAEVQRADRELQRLQAAADAGGSIGALDLDNARSRADEAAARLDQAAAELTAAESDVSLAQRRLDDMTIRAPFAGRVLTLQTELGQWLGAGDAVVELIALDTVEAWIDVPERLIGFLQEGESIVQIRVDAVDRTTEATVHRIIPAADPLSRLFPARLILPNPDGRLRPGMGVVGLIPTGVREPVITIPKDALLRDAAGEFVYYAMDTETGPPIAAVARIRTLFASGDRVAVRADQLLPGARVVVEGNERLMPNQPLQIIQPRDGAPNGGPPNGGRG